MSKKFDIMSKKFDMIRPSDGPISNEVWYVNGRIGRYWGGKWREEPSLFREWQMPKSK